MQSIVVVSEPVTKYYYHSLIEGKLIQKIHCCLDSWKASRWHNRRSHRQITKRYDDDDCKQFHKRYLSHHSQKLALKKLSEIESKSPRGHRANLRNIFNNQGRKRLHNTYP